MRTETEIFQHLASRFASPVTESLNTIELGRIRDKISYDTGATTKSRWSYFDWKLKVVSKIFRFCFYSRRLYIFVLVLVWLRKLIYAWKISWRIKWIVFCFRVSPIRPPITYNWDCEYKWIDLWLLIVISVFVQHIINIINISIQHKLFVH